MNPLTQEDVRKRGYIQGTGDTRYALGSQGATDFLLKESDRLLRAPTTPEPTIGETYGSFRAPSAPDQNVTSALNTGIDLYGNLARTPVDEELTRSRVLSSFQREIDATNAVFAQKLNQTRQEGMGRLGSTRAVNARSGTLGSDFATANMDTVANQNMALEDLVRQEHMARLESISNTAAKLAADEIAAKRTAQKEGLDSYIKFISARDERKQQGLSQLAKAMVLQNADPAVMGDAALKKIAQTYGVTADDIIAAFSAAKKENDMTMEDRALAKAKIDAEVAKNSMFNISEGEAMYRRNPDGTVTLIGKNPKTFAPSSSGGVGSAPSAAAATAAATLGGNAQEILNSVRNLRYRSNDEASRIIGNVESAIARGDLQGAQDVIRDFGYQKMSTSQQTDFDLYDAAQSAFQNAVSQIESGIATQAGPYKALAESAKPFALMQRDKAYVDLRNIIEIGQAQLRKGYYGTAVTGAEAANAKNFLITDSDDIDTIKWKAQNGAQFLEFVKDANLARTMGMPKPDINQYLAPAPIELSDTLDDQEAYDAWYESVYKKKPPATAQPATPAAPQSVAPRQPVMPSMTQGYKPLTIQSYFN